MPSEKRKSTSNNPEKEKKTKVESEDVNLDSLSPIAKPLANKKLNKKIQKCIKRAAKTRNLKRGVKEVVKGINKGEKGIVILAGNISPIDILTHIPILCEETGISYIYIPSKEELGEASGTKRPTSCMMITQKSSKPKKGQEDDIKDKVEEFKQLYAELQEEISDLNTKIAF